MLCGCVPVDPTEFDFVPKLPPTCCLRGGLSDCVPVDPVGLNCVPVEPLNCV